MDTKWALITESGLVDKKINPIDGVVVLGREAGCGIVIKKNEISRQHSQLESKGGGLFVKDLGSANGTLVNGTKISGEVELKINDVIKLEAIEFSVGEGRDPVQARTEAGSAAAQTAIMPSIGAGSPSPAAEATQMQLSVGKTFLSVVRGKSSAGDRINLDNMHSLKIGRSPNCDISLDDPTVSGEHALLSLENNGWQISNISKTNGLFISGNKIIKHSLKDGDVIEIGSSVLKFSSDDSDEGDGSDRKIPDWMRDQC